MPSIPPNTQYIYQVFLTGNFLHRPKLGCSFCFAAVVPGGPLDDPVTCISMVAPVLWPALDEISGASPIFQDATVAPMPYDRIAPVFRINRGSTFPAATTSIAPEASFILRRVGATTDKQKHGRILVPIWSDAEFIDFPRCRQINPATTRLAAALANFTAGIAGLSPYWTEVLYNRRTGEAHPIAAYSIAARVGRVWHRAGWGQR